MAMGEGEIGSNRLAKCEADENIDKKANGSRERRVSEIKIETRMEIDSTK